jgi:hypothetical protein
MMALATVLGGFAAEAEHPISVPSIDLPSTKPPNRLVASPGARKGIPAPPGGQFFSPSLLAAVSVESPGWLSARDFYNEGTRKLQEGKLREAEQWLQNAAGGFDEAVQQSALYNLGYVRFRQGEEALKEEPQGAATQPAANLALTTSARVIQIADAALASNELSAIMAAYRQGRGARKELKSAVEAVRRALDAHGAVLLRWQRAWGDFKSAVELRNADADARSNAEYVARRIAELVDQIRMMQMQSQGLRDKQDELGQRMAELKKRLPPSARQEGDEDEEENERPESKQGQKEAPSQEGRDLSMTLEEAARLLDSLSLDANRKLPLGAQQSDKPTVRSGREW